MATIRYNCIEGLIVDLDPDHAIGRMVGQTKLEATPAVRLTPKLLFECHLCVRRVDLADDPKPSFCDPRRRDLDLR